MQHYLIFATLTIAQKDFKDTKLMECHLPVINPTERKVYMRIENNIQPKGVSEKQYNCGKYHHFHYENIDLIKFDIVQDLCTWLS